MSNPTIQQEISLGHLPIFTYINGKCRTCQAIALEDDEEHYIVYNIQTAARSRLIKIDTSDYETLFGESLDTQDNEIMMYVDDDGQLKIWKNTKPQSESLEESSSPEFQAMKAKIQNNSDNFVEEILKISPESEEYSDAKKEFANLFNIDNVTDFVQALQDFRDKYLKGLDFSESEDTDLSEYLDDICDSDGNLESICNIITVLE